MSEFVTLEYRGHRLTAAIARHTRDGWVASSQTETTAQLVKPSQKSGWVLLVLLMFGILSGILYAVWPASQDTMFLRVNEQGRVFVKSAS